MSIPMAQSYWVQEPLVLGFVQERVPTSSASQEHALRMIQVSQTLWAAGQIGPSSLHMIQQAGIKSIVCLRDTTEPGYFNIASMVQPLGIEVYLHPISKEKCELIRVSRASRESDLCHTACNSLPHALL
jgi:hypothetical protein